MKQLLLIGILLLHISLSAQDNPVILIVKDLAGEDSLQLNVGDFILYSKNIDKPKVKAVIQEIHAEKLILSGVRNHQTYDRSYSDFYNLSLLSLNTKTFRTRRIFGFTAIGLGVGALALTTKMATLNQPFKPCDEDLPTRYCGSPRRTIRNIVLGTGLTVGGIIPLAMNARALNRFKWMNAPVFEVIEIPPYQSK